MLLRTNGAKFETRDENDIKYIEGYFSVFGGVYNMWDGRTETVDPHAFDETIDDDIRCLTDHKSELVLGRTKRGTLELRVDDVGLFGRVAINPNDSDAMNTYERVKRGDVDQCSFGFDILEQDIENRRDGVFITLKKVKLYEVSIVTFPAYEDTYVIRRKKDFDAEMNERRSAWAGDRLEKLKGLMKWH